MNILVIRVQECCSIGKNFCTCIYPKGYSSFIKEIVWIIHNTVWKLHFQIYCLKDKFEDDIDLVQHCLMKGVKKETIDALEKEKLKADFEFVCG